MKKISLLPLLFFGFIACSVDQEELNISKTSLEGLNLNISIDACEPEIFNYENNLGSLEVTNDETTLYITILAPEGYNLTNTKLQVEDDILDFPTVGKGNLPPGKMEYQQNFTAPTDQYTFTLPYSEGDCSVIASYSTFSDGENVISSWAGTETEKNGDWSYINYCFQDCFTTADPCVPVDAGENQERVMTLHDAQTQGATDGAVRRLYLDMLEEGIYSGQTLVFNPTIAELVGQFNSSPIGTFTTILTIGEGECADSVELSITVVPNGSI